MCGWVVGWLGACVGGWVWVHVCVCVCVCVRVKGPKIIYMYARTYSAYVRMTIPKSYTHGKMFLRRSHV